VFEPVGAADGSRELQTGAGVEEKGGRGVQRLEALAVDCSEVTRGQRADNQMETRSDD